MVVIFLIAVKDEADICLPTLKILVFVLFPCGKVTAQKNRISISALQLRFYTASL
jgi:hypothetical protein